LLKPISNVRNAQAQQCWLVEWAGMGHCEIESDQGHERSVPIECSDIVDHLVDGPPRQPERTC